MDNKEFKNVIEFSDVLSDYMSKVNKDNVTKLGSKQRLCNKVDNNLEEKKPTCNLYYGTGEEYCEYIEKSGLVPKNRLYVHLSSDIYTALNVGKRFSNVVVYEINSYKMIEDNYKFYMSINGVWITDRVPYKYLRRLESSELEKYNNTL